MLLPLDHGSLFYETAGSGPAMLAMHGGLGLDHTVLRPWLDPLSRRVKLIYYDHLANGRSEFTGDPTSLSHEVWVDTADDLRAHLGHTRVILFGHSYGAFLALEYALRHPDRVAGLIVSNVAPALDYPEAIMANAERKAPDEETFRAVIDLLSGPVDNDSAWAEGFRRVSPLYFHDWDAAVSGPMLENVRFRADAVNRATFGCLPSYNVEQRLGEITAPTLVLSGADDWITPPDHGGRRVAAGIPGAEHVVFQESGHWPFVEETERFLRVVEGWLERTGLTESPATATRRGDHG